MGMLYDFIVFMEDQLMKDFYSKGCLPVQTTSLTVLTSKQTKMTRLDIVGYLHTIIHNAFSNIYLSHGAALSVGSITAICESSFLVLTLIMTPLRRIMKRKQKYVIYASLNKSSIEKDNFLKLFVLLCRRLWLF